MKRIFDGSGWILVFAVLLSGCKYPAMQEMGWIIPYGSGALCLWSLARFFFGWGNKQAKRSRFAFIAAIITAALCIGYIIYAKFSQ